MLRIAGESWTVPGRKFKATRRSAGASRRRAKCATRASDASFPNDQPTIGGPMTANTNTAGAHQAGVQGQLLQPGTPAPDFTLAHAPDAQTRLAELRGRPVILLFYPADWSPVCGDEVALFNEVLPEFQAHNAQLLGISVDGVWCHQAFAKARNLRFPLLADFEPKGAVSRAYGAYRAKDGISERALFLIDAGGVIRWSYLSPISVNPGVDGVLGALEALPAATAGAGAGR
jgi:peroxiredoxin